MKAILITLLGIVTVTHAQLVTRNALKAEILASNAPIISAIAAANTTNAAQTTAIANANTTNASQTAAIAAANTTNASQTVAIAGKQTGSVTLSNFLAYLIANGVTNIAAGTNVVIYVDSGILIINASGGGTGNGSTNLLPVIQATNVLAEHIESDEFDVGLLVPTNTVYVTTTNSAVSQTTNYVADFSKSEQTIMAVGAVNFAHGTNLWAGVTNAYVCFSLINFSGSDQTLSIPAAWRRSLSFPTILTNRTITQLALKNYGGLSQSNILAGAAQF